MIVHVPHELLNKLSAENDAINKELKALAVRTTQPNCPPEVKARMKALEKRFIEIQHELLAAQIKPARKDGAEPS